MPQQNEQPKPADVARELERLHAWFLKTHHAFLPWIAYGACRRYGVPIPEWVLGEFDKSCEHLSESMRARKSVTKPKPFTWAEILRIFGCPTKNPFSSWGLFVRNHTIAARKRLKVDAGQKQVNEKIAEEIGEWLPDGIDIKIVERAWTKYQTLVRADDPKVLNSQIAQTNEFLQAYGKSLPRRSKKDQS